MYLRLIRSTRGWETCVIAAAMSLVGGFLTIGCEPMPPGNPTADQVRRMPIEANIIEVKAFSSSIDPWMWDEGRSRVRGVIIGALYLVGPDGRGVFGDGIIRPKVFMLVRDDQGGKKPVLAKEWAFDVDKAMPFRSKKRVIPGWGYLLPLDWGDMALAGKEIRVIVSFERRDGVVVHSGKKDHVVPK